MAANWWVERSIELANEPGYLDKLARIYFVEEPRDREVPSELLRVIKEDYDSGRDAALVEDLLKLDKFPVEDPHATLLKHLFRRSPSAIEENPQTGRRIADRIRVLDWIQLEGAIRAPKVPNRQMGRRFSDWLETLGYDFLNDNELSSAEEIAFLSGSDEARKRYAKRHFGYSAQRGLDLVAKCGSRYIVGEAKFLADHGGNQNNNFNSAMNLVNNQESLSGAAAVAILDGVVWLGGRSQMYEAVVSTSHDVMSALLFEEYLENLLQRSA